LLKLAVRDSNMAARHVIPVLLLVPTLAALVVLWHVSFEDFGEKDLSLPACSRELCAGNTTAMCLYGDSPCRGKYCNKRCDEWLSMVVANGGVPMCTCDKFCAGACYTPSCVSCKSSELPLWIQNLAGPLGTGLLCCPHGGSEGNPEACCAQGHAAKYGSCCELERPRCDCAWGTAGVTLDSFDPRSVKVATALGVFAVVALPALLCCRRPLPKGHYPRGADMMLYSAYLLAIVVAATEAKWQWQLASKPAELLPAGACGTLATFALAIVLLPLDRTHALFRLTRVPFERAVKFHRRAGRAAALLVVLHGALELYVQGLAEVWTFAFEPWGFGNGYGSIAGLASIALLVASVGQIRRSCYELFLWVHRALSMILLVAGALHCFAFATLAAVCLSLHGASLVARRLRRTSPLVALRHRRLGVAEIDSEAALLEVPWRRGGNAADEPLPPGTWFLLQAAGSREWHPYSVAAESRDSITFLVKNMGAESWSARFVRQAPASVRIEGPHGGSGFAPGHLTNLLLVGGGVGLTPLLRLWLSPPAGVSHVELVWVARCPEAMEWLEALLPSASAAPGRERGTIRVYVTRQSQRERAPSATWAAGVSADDTMSFDGDLRVEPAMLDEGARRAMLAHEVELKVARSADGAQKESPPDGSRGSGGSGATSLISAVDADASAESERLRSWQATRAAAAEGGSELVRQAAGLSWDPDAAPICVGPHILLQAGRPNLARVCSDLGSQHFGDWGVVACGPQSLVDDTRRCAANHCMRVHVEEFAW